MRSKVGEAPYEYKLGGWEREFEWLGQLLVGFGRP